MYLSQYQQVNVLYFNFCVCVFVCSQVHVIKEAYLQGVECEVDVEISGDQISPKDVGHNIYILAHQVGF